MAPAQRKASYDDNVFLNVPFDNRYSELFRALVFAVHDCGFNARCALEADNSADVRVEKLYRIIRECRFGIHDISRTSLDRVNRLPRFNMPLELGLFLGAKAYGGPTQRSKSCLVLDSEPYRYQIFCSDISGQEVRAHGEKASSAVVRVRDWLNTARRHPQGFIPGGRKMARRFAEFRGLLPRQCSANYITLSEMTFIDYRNFVVAWLEQNEW